MRILHVVATLAPESGGLSKAVASLAALQANHGHQVGILYFGEAEGEVGIDRNFGSFPDFGDVKRIRCRKTFWETLFSKSSLGEVETFAPEVIHLHGLWEPLLKNIQQMAFRKGIRFGFTPHGMSTPWHDGRHRMKKRILKTVLGWDKTWRKADWVHVLNKQEERIWKGRGFQNVHLIPNAVFAGEMSEAKDVSSPELPVPYILFLGRLHPQKHPDMLLELFFKIAATHPEMHLVFAGPDGGLGDLLQSRSLEAGLEARIHFTGMAEAEKKGAMLRHARLFVLPSRTEGHSLAVLEAGLAGIPMLLSGGSEVSEIVEAGGAKVLTGDLNADANNLSELLRDEQGLNDMGDKAQSCVLDSFVWEKRIPLFMGLYQSGTPFSSVEK